MIISILGAGSWGTALALHCARLQHEVRLWTREKDFIEEMKKTRSNERYLPHITFPENLIPTSEIKAALHQTDCIVIAVPSHAFRQVLEKISTLHDKITPVISAAKGLDPTSHQLLHEVVSETLGDIPFGVLSGPTFATEVAKTLPTAVTLASSSKTVLSQGLSFFHNQNFRVYQSHDVIGVEIGGAMKNVLAIAVGIAEGLELGANTKAALITRGLAEMMRLGQALGAKPETLMGLAGVGDLVLTCTDNQSRNRRFGLALGQQKNRHEAEKQIGQVVEGINTAKEIYTLAKQYHVEVPITEQIYRLLYENISPKSALQNLISREPKKE